MCNIHRYHIHITTVTMLASNKLKQRLKPYLRLKPHFYKKCNEMAIEQKILHLVDLFCPNTNGSGTDGRADQGKILQSCLGSHPSHLLCLVTMSNDTAFQFPMIYSLERVLNIQVLHPYILPKVASAEQSLPEPHSLPLTELKDMQTRAES